jgi:hypothetical protein
MAKKIIKKQALFLFSLLFLSLFFLTACGNGTLTIKTEKLAKPTSLPYTITKGGSLVYEGVTDEKGIASHNLAAGTYVVHIPNDLFIHNITAQVVRGQTAEVYENLGLARIQTSKVDPKTMTLYDDKGNAFSFKTNKGGNKDLYLPEVETGKDYDYIVDYGEDNKKIEIRHGTPTPVILMWSS